MRTLLFILLLLFATGISARAQALTQPGAPSSLLLSQPNIDTTSPVSAVAAFDPPVIRPGGKTIYRVKFNAMLDSVKWEEEIIAPRQLEMQPGARGQVYSSAGTNIQPNAIFNTLVRATGAGTFTVPRYLVYVYGKPVTVPAATLLVTEDPAIPDIQSPAIFLRTSATNVFIGQKLTAGVVFPGASNGAIQTLSMVKFNGDGLVPDLYSVRQSIERLPTENTGPKFTYEMDLTPMKPGRVELTAQGFTAGNQFSGPITITGQVIIPGGRPNYDLLETPPLTLTVRPVPREGELPGFTGAIGQYKLDLPTLATSLLRVGDPVTLTVNVRGEGHLARLVAPPPPQVKGWRVFAGPRDNTPPQLIRANGFIQFTYTLIPTSEECRTTPVIPFSSFDPIQAAFVNLSLPAVNVTVNPGATPVDEQALAEAESGTVEREKEPALTGMAATPGRTISSLLPRQQHVWFWLAQFIPAMTLAALWWWDRRRRYFEQHPEILLRRRARRALQREWAALRRAVEAGDDSRFTTCAINALRIACAPHYPAEPRALVSTDVLPLLSAPADKAIEAVQRIFAAANADRFATEPACAKELLALHPELNRVLMQLEEKLR